MLKIGLLVLPMIALISGCAMLGQETDLGCTWSKPIYISRDDHLTIDTARQILAHNEIGAERCGWKPVKK